VIAMTENRIAGSVGGPLFIHYHVFFCVDGSNSLSIIMFSFALMDQTRDLMNI
jgi:hypothetical protein